MAYESNKKRPLNAEDTIKLFVAMKVIEAMNTRDRLFADLNYTKENSPKLISFKNFLTSFNGLFSTTKHNIKRSLKIKDWDKKEENYENFFEKEHFDNTGTSFTKNMREGLKIFDEFIGDLVQSGLWKLLEDAATGYEGFEDEDLQEEGIEIGVLEE